MPKKKATPKLPPNRDPEHMRLIGARGGRKTAKKKGKAFFRRIARLSHPKNNPNSRRGKYKGGRPKPPEAATEA